MLKAGPVLPVEDVLRHDVDADVIFVRHEEEETRRRNFEIDDYRIGIGRSRLLDGLLHVDAPAHLGPEIAQAVQRICDIFGAERLAVAPADAGPRLDRQALEVW